MDQGAYVVGAELSETACIAFEEHSLKYKRSQSHGLIILESESINLFCGDFFLLTKEDLGKIDGCYDRAAMIALPWKCEKNTLKRSRDSVLILFY